MIAPDLKRYSDFVNHKIYHKVSGSPTGVAWLATLRQWDATSKDGTRSATRMIVVSKAASSKETFELSLRSCVAASTSAA